jgi:iron complex outermembrane receptor protein
MKRDGAERDCVSISQSMRELFGMSCLSLARVAALAVPVLMTAGVTSAMAQSSNAAAVEEVVVTAQKREERLQDVPIAISVVNNELLKSTNARNLAELQGAVPSVYFAGNSGGGRTYVTLRGATGLALNSGDEPVAVYMDDVYLGRGVTVGMADLLDIGAIEIVRGPQGTLQGRNATAGALLIRSADPTATPEGRVTLSLADPQEFRGQAVISGPIAQDLTARLSLGYLKDRGWATNTVTGKHIGGAESHQARVVLAYKPDTGLDARLVADYSRVSNQPAIVRWGATTFSPLATGALVPAGTATPQIPLSQAQQDAIKKDDEFALLPGTFTTVQTGGFTGKISYAFENVDLVSVSGYRETQVRGLNDSDGLAVDRMGYNTNVDLSEQWSQELRLQSSGERRFSWIVGLYGFEEQQFYDSTIYNLRFTTPTATGTRYTGDIKTTSLAAFADATFKLTDQLSIIGGVRRTEDKKTIDGYIVVNNFTTGAAPVTTRYLAPAAKYKDTSYRAKLVWKPSQDLMMFVGYGKGFRSGGWNPFAIQPPYAPETNKSLEAGLKGDFFERRLSMSLAAYRNLYTNLQLRAGVPTGGAIITNAADSKIRGLEAEFTLRPTDTIRLTANGAYTDAKFTSFPTARDIFDRPVDASGNRLPRTPKWQYFLSGAKDFELGGGSVVTAEVNYRWRGRVYFYFTDQNVPTWTDGPGDELGARISWQDADRKWQVAAFGTNLTNSRIINTAAVTFSYPQVGFNKPRVLGVSVERRF